jgi:Zn ribbon nucleic-acid-binding protein
MPDVKTTHGRYAQPPARDLAHLGPILPACPVCGAMQYWHNHQTDVWECWDCVPPVPHQHKETTL